MRISLMLAGIAATLAFSPAAQAQLASPPASNGPATVYRPAQPPSSKAQDADIGTQASQAPLEISNATQLVRTMAGPGASTRPRFIQCDPRTLAQPPRSDRIGAEPVDDALVLGREGQVVVADNVYFAGTSDGTQCPALGKSFDLPPFLLEVQK